VIAPFEVYAFEWKIGKPWRIFFFNIAYEHVDFATYCFCKMFVRVKNKNHRSFFGCGNIVLLSPS